MFQGNLVAIVTPMHLGGEVDYAALKHLVHWHQEQGSDGIVILGTTGESPTINDEERTLIIQCVLEELKGKLPVIVGTGTNATTTSIAYTRQAMEAGADACLLVTPYYNKPTQEGLFQHYQAIADAVAIPQILYNVPGRTGCDLLPETVARLAKACSNIVALKDASGKLERMAEYKALECTIDLLSGDDATACEFMLMGGQGVISVTSNVAPGLMTDLCRAALANQRAEAEAIDARLAKLHQDLFIESNPIPVKWALTQMGRIQAGIRLPLTPLSEHCYPRVREALVMIEEHK